MTSTFYMDTIDKTLDIICYEIHKAVDLFRCIEFNTKANASILNNQIFVDNYLDNFVNMDEFKIFVLDVAKTIKLPNILMCKKLDTILDHYNFYDVFNNIIINSDMETVDFINQNRHYYLDIFTNYCNSKSTNLGTHVVKLIFKKILGDINAEEAKRKRF